MAIQLVHLLTWTSLAERVGGLVFKLVSLFRKPPATTEEPPATSKPITRQRPAKLPVVLLCMAATLVGTVGCATDQMLKKDDLASYLKLTLSEQERKDLANELAPCDPCPQPVEPKPVEPKPADPAEPPKPPEKPVEADSHTFLWKPIADTAPVLYIITPAQLECRSVSLFTRKKVKETGVYRPPRANGNRQHFGFSKKGEAYGKKVKVVCMLAEGGTKEWLIPDGSKRFESR